MVLSRYKHMPSIPVKKRSWIDNIFNESGGVGVNTPHRESLRIDHRPPCIRMTPCLFKHALKHACKLSCFDMARPRNRPGQWKMVNGCFVPPRPHDSPLTDDQWFMEYYNHVHMKMPEAKPDDPRTEQEYVMDYCNEHAFRLLSTRSKIFKAALKARAQAAQADASLDGAPGAAQADKPRKYVPTGRPRGRPPGRKSAPVAAQADAPVKPRKYVPTGRPRGRPPGRKSKD